MAIPSLTTLLVVVLDAQNRALHCELLPEIANAPNHGVPLAALK